MERIELITSKEYWVETLELMQMQGHTDYDIATVIAYKMKEAMNYIPCCTELKDKEAITFEEWKKENVVEKNVCNEYLYKYGGWFDADDLLSMYKKDISL